MLHVLILAAGQGKRMHSDTPKVLHEVLFQPLIHHVIRTSQTLAPKTLITVVGHGEAAVRESCMGFGEIQYVTQKEQKGTGHAIKMAENLLREREGTLLVLSGDVILLRPETLKEFAAHHAKSGAAATLLTATLPDGKNYGRILRAKNGDVLGIREAGDCNPQEKAIREINSGIYAFEIRSLLSALGKLNDRNRQAEFYLTDTIEILRQEKKDVGGYTLEDPNECLGINDRRELAVVETILQERINNRWMEKGVTLIQPETIRIDTQTQIGRDVTIEPGCTIIQSNLQDHCYLKQGCYIEHSTIGINSSVGPYAHLRPGSKLEADVKIGNFVEVKKSVLKRGSKASHLSYIGDAEIGENVNLGCGFITCNYDGKNKHKTIIEEDVFVGSDSQAVAPITIGKGAYVASGTTLTRDVPPGALAISRGKQENKEGYAKRLGKGR